MLELEKVHAQASTSESISHTKHFAHALRRTTCVAFGSFLTLDVVTDGRGSKLSQREPSWNSSECQKHLIAALERLKGYICSTLLLVGYNAWTVNLTPAGVWGSASHCCSAGCDLSNWICIMFCVSVRLIYSLTNLGALHPLNCLWQR